MNVPNLRRSIAGRYGLGALGYPGMPGRLALIETPKETLKTELAS